MPETFVHFPTFRLNSVLLGVFITLAVVLWLGMPDAYPVHLDLQGRPTRWADDGPGMWILLVALCTLSFGKSHLLQRFLINDPDSTLLNVPYKKAFRKLPRERKIPVVRRLNRLLGLVNTGMLAAYICLLLLIYYAAHNPDSLAAALANYALAAALAFIVLVPLAETLALGRQIRRKLQEEGLDPGG